MQSILSPQTSWHFYIAKEIAHGKELYKDFFDMTSPIIFMFFNIASGFSKIFHKPHIVSISIFNNTVAIAVLGITLGILRRNFNKKHRILLIPICTYTIFLSAGISDLFEFFSVEHICIILSFPYFLSIYNTEDKTDLLSCTIGFMAGLSCCINPFFILFVLVTEGYRKTINLPILRPQVVAFSSCIVLYILYFYSFHIDNFMALIPHAIEKQHYLYQCGYACIGNGLIKNLLVEILGACIALVYLKKHSRYWLAMLITSLFVLLLHAPQNGDIEYITTLFLSVITIGICLSESYMTIKNSRVKVISLLTAALLLIIGLSKTMFITIPSASSKELYNKSGYIEIISLFKTYPNIKVYALSESPSPFFPIITAYQDNWPAKENSMELLESLFKAQNQEIKFPVAITRYILRDVINAVASKPDLIMVQKGKYIRFFQMFREFRKQWDSYKIIGFSQIGHQKYAVYQRKDLEISKAPAPTTEKETSR